VTESERAAIATWSLVLLRTRGWSLWPYAWEKLLNLAGVDTNEIEHVKSLRMNIPPRQIHKHADAMCSIPCLNRVAHIDPPDTNTGTEVSCEHDLVLISM
jgi:hypothetical protein